MEVFAFIPILFMILLYGGLFVLLLYFIIKRIEAKSKENFEQRDN